MPCAKLPVCTNNRAKISSSLVNKVPFMVYTLAKCRCDVNEHARKIHFAIRSPGCPMR